MTFTNVAVPGSMALVILFGLAGCTESTVEPRDHEEPEGVVLRVDGTEVLRLREDETGSLPEISVGDSSAIFEVRFLSNDGDVFLPDESEAYRLDTRVGDSSVARSTSDTLLDKWSFQLEGVGPGETTIQVVLLHGTHADFISGDLTLEVTE